MRRTEHAWEASFLLCINVLSISCPVVSSKAFMEF
jgi:hypothetical protein